MGHQHDLWSSALKKLGGQFWPSEPREEGQMGQVGAKYPLMLFKAGIECIVYDEEEERDARGHGFKMQGEDAKEEHLGDPPTLGGGSPNAKHEPKAKEDDAGGQTQSGVRQEDGHPPASSGGVRSSGPAPKPAESPKKK